MEMEMTLSESFILQEILALALLILMVAYAVTPLKTKFPYGTRFLLEFVILVIPIILTVTYLSEYLLWTLLAQIITLCALARKEFTKDKLREARNFEIKDATKYPCNCYVRSVLYLSTIICILAVDFNIFPGKFSKTEKFGYSLMDTGVGLFVANMGFASYGVITKQVTLTKTLLSTLPLFVLGIGRAAVVRILDYPHSVTEYGTDWNFFCTLAILKFVNAIFLPCARRYIIAIALCLLVAHQSALHYGLEEWIMSDAPRGTFVSANREGIFSLAGYEVVYLIFAITRNFATFPKKGDTIRDYASPIIKIAVIAFASLVATVISESVFGVSRRSVNTGYIFWIAALHSFNILNGVLFDVFCVALASDINYEKPIIARSISHYGLWFFLLANLLTGFVNLIIDTKLVENSVSFITITIYAFVCCAAVAIADSDIRFRLLRRRRNS